MSSGRCSTSPRSSPTTCSAERRCRPSTPAWFASPTRARIPGRAGNGRLERLLDHVHERTRSELEKVVLAIVRAAGLPEPERNVAIGRFVVDLAWPQQRVIVEADSWEWHSSRAAFEADRARDLELHTLGWTVLRVTWRQLDERPRLLTDALAAAGAHTAAIEPRLSHQRRPSVPTRAPSRSRARATGGARRRR